jgi:hypothetical protein
MENGPNLRLGLLEINEIHVKRVPFNFQLGFLLWEPLRQSAAWNWHNFFESEVENSYKIQLWSASR